MIGAGRFEYATAHDPALNYCLWAYEPPALATDKFRSLNLLLHSFDHAGLDARAYEMIDAIREGIGDFRTVFGVKHLGDRLAWEFYFYDYARRNREVSMSRVLAALRPFARCDVPLDENLPYFMFSLDLDAALACGRRDIEVVHMYVGNPGSAVSSGVAYALSAAGTRLENFYFFFDARAQRQEAADKIASSAFFDATRLDIDAVLVPAWRDCRTICVANKQTHDCVYFSGVGVDQLMDFLTRLKYPAALVDFVRANRHRLDHLRYDVGFDYRVENGALVVLKSGYYGVF